LHLSVNAKFANSKTTPVVFLLLRKADMHHNLANTVYGSVDKKSEEF